MADKNTRIIAISNETVLKIFRLRFKGHTYDQIESLINGRYKSRTMELYFYKGGKWHDAYDTWREFQITQIKDQINDMFIAQAIEANQQIINISRGQLYIKIPGKTPEEDQLLPLSLKGDTVLRASQDILDRAGFKAPEKVEVSDPDDKAEKMLLALEKIKAQKVANKKKINE